jgi:addiction module HigA family antidote
MFMHNPPDPGEVILELCLEPLDLSVTEAAKALGVSRKTLSTIVNGRAGISPEMAVRLSIAFDTTSKSWLNHQPHYDLFGMRSSTAKNCMSNVLWQPSQCLPYNNRLTVAM